ncbi:hypothetical protein APE_1209 [Aeropyrum pernix K1]|uniref:Uncharacterized protein n=1 Tax=Aeropyrum pernix (strain ATCC 700893 / DSM 11879 / JCM 9820 / NBRC 100138 / K1) TaxID=272557 RepID=Q9YCQ2_AERPE|nr:hypothetical protein [Aeropyrum pernix]BAA80195.1 hypothetical protein APE_1209 [Aeropyrum pernix K1]
MKEDDDLRKDDSYFVILVENLKSAKHMVLDQMGWIHNVDSGTLRSREHIRLLAEALEDLWGVFQDALQVEKPWGREDSVYLFYVNNILPRYVIGVQAVGLLCVSELAYVLLRIALEYLEKALILDFHPRCRDLPLNTRLEMFGLEDLRRLSRRERSEQACRKRCIISVDCLEDTFKLMVGDDKLAGEIVESLREDYRLLSQIIHGNAPILHLLKSEEVTEKTATQALGIAPCIEAEEEARLIAHAVTRFSQFLKATVETVKLVKL